MGNTAGLSDSRLLLRKVSPSSASDCYLAYGPTWSLGAMDRNGCGADFQERCAMILGMNGGALRPQRMWSVYLWKQQRHWAIVLQAASDPFEARAVDDFMYHAQQCCHVEVPSSRFFLVYELLLPNGFPRLMIGVKTDFDPERPCVHPLGNVGPVSFEEICAEAVAVVDSYRCYSLVGSNCQHFTKDFASKLHAPVPFTPEDEAVANGAWRNAEKVSLVSCAIAVGCIGAVVAPDATMITAAAATASQVAFGASPMPLLAAAAGAGSVGLGAGIVLGSVGAGYGLLHAGLRTREGNNQHRNEEQPSGDNSLQSPPQQNQCESSDAYVQRDKQDGKEDDQHAEQRSQQSKINGDDRLEESVQQSYSVSSKDDEQLCRSLSSNVESGRQC